MSADTLVVRLREDQSIEEFLRQLRELLTLQGIDVPLKMQSNRWSPCCTLHFPPEPDFFTIILSEATKLAENVETNNFGCNDVLEEDQDSISSLVLK